MGDYEDLVELGIEGVDRLTDRYHDIVYARLPRVPDLKHSKREKKRRSSRHPDKGYSPHRSPVSDEEIHYEEDVAMYAPDRRQQRDYQSAADERYYGDERSYYYKGPSTGALVLRGGDNFNNARGFEVAPYQGGRDRGYDDRGNDDRGNDDRGYGDRGYDQPRGRPGPQRRRSSWSPPPSRKHHGDSHKPRASSRSKDKEHRMVAAVGGAIAGGFAGHKIAKGKKYGQVATIVGAIVGGVGAREATEFWDDHRRKDDEKEENWEDEFGKPERGSGGSDSRRGDRHDRN